MYISVRDCFDPADIENGGRNFTCTVVGCEADYYCDNGYEMVGQDLRICQPSGQWQPGVPYCKEISKNCIVITF